MLIAPAVFPPKPPSPLPKLLRLWCIPRPARGVFPRTPPIKAPAKPTTLVVLLLSPASWLLRTPLLPSPKFGVALPCTPPPPPPPAPPPVNEFIDVPVNPTTVLTPCRFPSKPLTPSPCWNVLVPLFICWFIIISCKRWCTAFCVSWCCCWLPWPDCCRDGCCCCSSRPTAPPTTPAEFCCWSVLASRLRFDKEPAKAAPPENEVSEFWKGSEFVGKFWHDAERGPPTPEQDCCCCCCCKFWWMYCCCWVWRPTTPRELLEKFVSWVFCNREPACKGFCNDVSELLWKNEVSGFETPPAGGSWIGLLRLFPMWPLIPVCSCCCCCCWRLVRELLGTVSAIRLCSSKCSCCCCCCSCWCCCCRAWLLIKLAVLGWELCLGKLCKLSALQIPC